MKIIFACIAFAAFCGVALSGLPYAEFDERLEQYQKPCYEKHGVTESDFDIFKKDDFKPEDVTKKMKCATHCVLNKGGYLSDEGKFVPETIRPKLNENEVKAFEKAVEKCGEISAEDACETTFLTIRCLMELEVEN